MAEIGYQHIVCDPDKCMGCRMCEYACSATKTGDFNPAMSRIRVVRIEPVTMLAISCRLCSDAPCVQACPRDALTRAENGTILVDTDKCDGCGWCAEACEFGAVVLDPTTKVAAMCDLCVDEEDGPRCVAFCPKDALQLATPEQVRQQTRREVVAKLFEELL